MICAPLIFKVLPSNSASWSLRSVASTLPYRFAPSRACSRLTLALALKGPMPTLALVFHPLWCLFHAPPELPNSSLSVDPSLPQCSALIVTLRTTRNCIGTIGIRLSWFSAWPSIVPSLIACFL